MSFSINSIESVKELFYDLQKILKNTNEFIVIGPLDIEYAFNDISLVDNEFKWIEDNEKLLKVIIIALDKFNLIKKELKVSLANLFETYLAFINRLYGCDISNIESTEILHMSISIVNKYASILDVSDTIYYSFFLDILELDINQFIRANEYNMIYSSLISYYNRHKKMQNFKKVKDIYDTIIYKLNSDEKLSASEIIYIINSMTDEMYNKISPFSYSSPINEYFNVLLKLLSLVYPSSNSMDEKLQSNVRSISVLHKRNIFIYSENITLYNTYKGITTDLKTVNDISSIIYSDI